MTKQFIIEVLADDDNRQGFSSGVKVLDRYFLQQATQEVRRRAKACYVAVETATGHIAGYYTLAAGGIPLKDMPGDIINHQPRYPSVPVARLGRLAVSSSFQGQRLGAGLLWDALLRSARSEVTVFALVADAKDNAAEKFYRYHGFVGFGSLLYQLIFTLADHTT